MIEVCCCSARKTNVAESAIGKRLRCPDCGSILKLVSAETLSAGAGAGDIPPYTGTTNLTYDAALGFRILSSPLFFWGGAKRSYFATGLDLRLFDESLGVSSDVYQFGRDTAQLDLAGRWRFFNVFSLTGGADDVLLKPHYHAGLMFTYDDQDLTSILIKIKTGL